MKKCTLKHTLKPQNLAGLTSTCSDSQLTKPQATGGRQLGVLVLPAKMTASAQAL